MVVEPELRAGVVADVVKALITDFPQWEGLLDASVRRRLAVTAATSWVPAHWLFDLEGAVYAAHGADAVRALRRRAVTLTMEHGLLRPIRPVADDPSPATFLRCAPGARAQGMRGLGETTYQPTRRGARLRITGAPAHILASPAWRAGSEGALLGALDLAGARGTVTAGDDGADVVFDVEWRSARRRSRAG